MNEKQKRDMIERRNIVAQLWSKNRTYRQIASEVAVMLGISVPSLKTIHSDIQAMKKEWREERVKDTEERIERELMQIDATIAELWDAWEKSKTDTKLNYAKKRNESGGTLRGFGKDVSEKGVKEMLMLGDVRYIAEIRAQQQERRKLEGLYPDTKLKLSNPDGSPLLDQVRTVVTNMPEKQFNDLLEVALNTNRDG